MRQGKWWLLLVAGLGLSGCTAFVARQIERPGHTGGSFRSFDETLLKMGFARESALLPDGVRMAYWIAPPRAYQIKESFRSQPAGKKGRTFSFDMSFGHGPIEPKPIAIKGSVVLLHPWSMNGTAMMPWGLHFAAAGYQVVMPDLRSQGDSSDAPVGYGPREAGDIRELIERLRRRGDLPAPLYLFGASYGASVALFAAPVVPDLRGVVALEPYANAAAVIRRAPASDLFGHRWLARWLNPQRMNAAIDRASRKLGVDLDAIDLADALSHSDRCSLILRGSRDQLTSRDALLASSKHSPLAVYADVPGMGHMELPLRTDLLFQPVLAWMQALPAAPQACPGFVPPAKPSASEPASRAAGDRVPPR